MNINVAGASNYKKLITYYITQMIKEGFEVSVFDSFNDCSWNGGRVNNYAYNNNKLDFFEAYEFYNSLGVNVNAIMTNPNIKDFDDTLGNKILNTLNQSNKSEVTILDHSFNSYVQKHYKHINRKYSIIGSAENYKKPLTQRIDEYLALEEVYDIIVPSNDIITEEEFFKQINPSKYEIMLIDDCTFCSRMKEHYSFIHNNISEKNKRTIAKANECFELKQMYGRPGGPIIFDKELLKELTDKGINRFKQPGRELKQPEYNARLINLMKMLSIEESSSRISELLGSKRLNV